MLMSAGHFVDVHPHRRDKLFILKLISMSSSKFFIAIPQHHIQTNFFLYFPHNSFVGVFVQLNVAAYRKPHMIFVMHAEQDFIFVHNKGIYRKIYFFVYMGHIFILL